MFQTRPAVQAALHEQVVAEQLRAHYERIPAMVIAPTAGGLFTAWVLWDAVQNHYLVIGMGAVITLSVLRLMLYRRYFSLSPEQASASQWRWIAVAAAAVSGVIWGSAAPFLYPPTLPGYEVYLLVLLTLLPIVPVAALAVYMPAFYAYYVPCITPFVVLLALQESRPDRMTALLLLMMMGAMVTFANRYSHSLAEAIQLKLQLADKTQALEQAIQQKSRFIAAASHDLRQPVHAMGLFMEALRHGRDRSQDGKWIDYIEASLKNLRVMLNDMLDVSKLDASVVQARTCSFSAGDLLGKLHKEYAALAAQQGLDLRYAVRDTVLRSDAALLERMLRNLLSNALKYTTRGGIALVCRPRAHTALLQVVDTGSGIHEQHLNDIFREFTQIDSTQHGTARGLGLGLAIVERLARLLDHGIRVRSVVGRGSVFTIEVPLGDTLPQRLEPTTDEPPQPRLPSGLVVIVDDDEAVRTGTAALVQQWGHGTVVAASALQALQALAQCRESAGLLIVDHRLANGESGLDAIALIERHLQRKLPAIIITGDTAPQRIREAYEAGYPLLHKPVDAQQLSVCMASVQPTGAGGVATVPAFPDRSVAPRSP